MIIQSKNISKRSLFKLLLCGFGLGSLIFWLLLSILSMYATGSLTFDLDPGPGLERFTDTLFFWPLFALLWATFTWVFLILGLAILNKFTSLTLVIKE